MERLSSYRESAERYTALRIAGGVFTVLGYFFLAGGGVLLVLGLYALLTGGTVRPPRGEAVFTAGPVNGVTFPGALGGVLSILWSFGLLVSGLQFLATGALFKLVIHVEENTRISAQCLEHLRPRSEAAERTLGPSFRS